MTPTDFEFTLTLPGDTRLIGAVRQLAAQAAGYAQQTSDAGERLATHVERAIAVIVDATPSTSVHARFSGDAQAIDVVITCEGASPRSLPGPSANDGLTVDWRTEGSRHTCHIRQLLSKP
jgi:hypothetical protein